MRKNTVLALGLMALLATAPGLLAQHGGGGGHAGGGSGGHGGGHGGGGHAGGRGGGWSGHGGGYWGGHGGGYWGGHGGGHGGGYWGGWYGPGWGWGWGGWGGWGWGWGWGYPYYGGYYGYGYPGYYVAIPGPGWAVINTGVSPEEARVYLDGTYIGIADNFDGFPDYLYLRKGHYRIEFRLEGFETKVVEIDARPGAKFDIDDKLVKIRGAKQYGSYDTPEPPGGLHRFYGKKWSQGGSVTVPDEGEGGPPGDNAPYGQEPPQGQEPQGEPSGSGAVAAPDSWRGPAGSGSSTPPPARRPPSTRLVIHVEPPDAAIYVDDRFVGTAEELEGQPLGLRVSPGRHTVTVSRPGYKDQTVEVEVESGRSQSVEVELQR